MPWKSKHFLQTKVIIFKILLHCQCVLCFVQMVASNWVKFIIGFWSPIISIVFHDILSLFHYWMAHVLVVSNTCECIYLLLMWDMIAKKRRPFYYDRKPPLRCSRHPAIKKTEQFHNSEWFNQTDFFLITSTSNIEIWFVDKYFSTLYLNFLSSLKQDNIGIFYFNNIYINVPITNKCDQSYWFFFLQKLFCVSIKNMKL